MTTLLTSFVQGTLLKVTKCGVCGLVGHPNDKCLEVIEDVNIVRKHDPHGNTYNSGWRDNPNLRWGNDNQKHTQAPPTSSNQGTNLEDIIKALATNTFSFQQKMKQQMTQLTTAISKMDGKANFRLNRTMLMLAPKKKETPKEEELLEMFRKVQINLPLLDAIQQVPKYAKFLKELCTNKRKTKEREMELNQKQEERLIEVLKKKKQAIGWTLDDIKGISPTFCMHRIILEEGAKDKIQPQRRLNPTLKEVVMKEVLKLKDVGIIYPVPDSTWVSPIHVVPKKIGMTVVKNDKGEMVPMQMQNGWRMCIDYRKLNEV
ncbi:retrotransposon gag protein [Cucumis melo var. makuwa]|uniref:Retrotransposon gag protein n=1 Tax=Cucumis melo var. makuwa TaxID=1194695 RepID=A0A5A7VGL0_CUCMM|nr:retrotransposon gag protein [Cucumis melo var. makuwa]